LCLANKRFLIALHIIEWSNMTERLPDMIQYWMLLSD
jgi:hypothetical protein